MEESHEDCPIQQPSKITEVPNALNTFLLIFSVRFVSTFLSRLFINSTKKLSSWKATSSLTGQGSPCIL